MEPTPQPAAPEPAADASTRVDITGLTLPELAALMEQIGLEKYRAKQIWGWVYKQGVRDFDAMTNISKQARQTLADHCIIPRLQVVRDLTSIDQTRKWLLGMGDGNKVETVFIPDEERGTLCVSSQVGCTLTCSFCHTGTQKLVRNLTASEIVAQMLSARDGLGEWPAPVEGRLITNVVMMGMGEPLFNYDQVARAIKIMMHEEGLALSKRKITLSTSGVVPKMQQCADELGVNLAVSLHAVRDDLRNILVPLNKKYPIAELLEACKNYVANMPSRRVTFEYVMLNGVNDTDADAHELVRLLEGIPAKVNLIPFNPWPGSPYTCSTKARIQAFSQIVFDAGYASPVRTPRGQDIMAACGQLKSDSERQKGEKVKLH